MIIRIADLTVDRSEEWDTHEDEAEAGQARIRRRITALRGETREKADPPGADEEQPWQSAIREELGVD
ncbi:MAG TPA: hypothetical protein DEB30_03150 [Candidatus Peribacter riflensis]|uniref:Uncharacterized protein n=1 Tax=Candidatus Peribacter riflensis TaxID=1735162 RepID=A0A0S1SFC4_9BACT|nr:MAG: hypothetical protein PeribacterA2_0643 [Candidatus Peribacter riflensis]OGJ78971.1 MAG: hypothetical protein A2398_04685 [Candidatus Peribacteria bacterium RIFOXYB1_FULL_57_12]OGJ80641.1 MAG: hypothetical protein A2412_04920 [Candidatus Peribacteria bacterium RIFOXYC1_FULL_58_8]ALM11114.1 MAG: hypothetical protein PeribacterB2_0643 [Candidatus Peribacter riflensis]ALM12217.1 MAG: hypothetical protein PeribacterC2_0643 [Candidatus Peribacter riflensis]